MKLGVSDPQVVRVDDLIAYAKEIIETLKLAAVEFEYDGIGYSVDNSGRVLQNCTSSIWTVLREESKLIGEALKELSAPEPDPRDEALRVATEALEGIIGINYSAGYLPPHEPNAANAIEIARGALAAIRAAGGA